MGIYTSWTGQPVNRFSFSMANAVSECGHKAKLERIDGYETTEKRCYFKFGQAVEGAIRGWVESSCTRVIQDEFSAIWMTWKDADLVYKEQEKGWANMDSMGRRLVGRFQQAYEAGKVPPLMAHKFSEELLLPNWHNGSDLIYIADAIQQKVSLVDFKTSEKNRQEGFGNWVRLDRQLRVGALVSGVRDVGFVVMAWGNSGRVEWLPGHISEELVEDVDLWLKAQYGKYQRREFHRAAGTLFPNQVCTNCDMAKACLDGDYAGIRRRESKDAMEQMEGLSD